MNNIIAATALALSLAACAPSAQAKEFEGLRLEATAGADDFLNGKDNVDVIYGAGIGLDKQFGRFVIGVEATSDNVFDRSDIAVGGRAGFTLTKNTLVYGKVAYSTFRQFEGSHINGLRFGGGVEANVFGPFYVKTEYRYTDYETNKGRHAGFAGAGIRF